MVLLGKTPYAYDNQPVAVAIRKLASLTENDPGKPP
jgi:hypothetical protein